LATDHAAAPPRQVGFFVPSKFETEAAIPVPKDPTITIEPFPKAQYAVAVFGGFAKVGPTSLVVDGELLVKGNGCSRASLSSSSMS
jgi:hypothetical protein